MEENAIVNYNANENFVSELTVSENSAFCSFQPDTLEGKAQLYNAISSPDFRLSDCINTKINMTHVVCETVSCVSKETGEVTKCPRVIIIDDKGKSYQSVSMGVFNSIKRIFQMLGMPGDWEKPIPVEVKQITRGQNKMLTLKVSF